MTSCLHDLRVAPQLVGDPVDVVSGAYTDVARELLLPGPLEFDFRRHYSSALPGVRGALGWGHTHSYDHALVFDADGVRYEPPLGVPIGFPPLLFDGASAVSDGWRLLRRGSRSYRLVCAGRPSLEFDVRDIARRCGVTRIASGDASILLSYDGSGSLEGIVDSEGRRLRVLCDEAGRLLKLLLATEGEKDRPLLLFRYDAAGNLVEGTDPYGNHFRFAYDEKRRLVRKTDRAGYSFHFEYDASGRCTHARGDDGYDEVWLRYDADAVTTVREADGGEWTYLHPEGVLSKVIDPYGGVRTLVRDAGQRLLEERDPNGNAKLFVYDGYGALLGTRSPLGDFVSLANQETDPRRHVVAGCAAEWELGRFLDHASVDAPPERAAVLDALPTEAREAVAVRRNGERRGPVYDAGGKMVAEESGGRRRRYVYGPTGVVQRYTDFDGATWTYEHASWSQRVAEVDPHGVRTTFAYTASGLLEELVDGGGAATRFAYDLKDRLVAVHRHGVVKETYARDAADNLVETKDSEGRTLLTREIGERNLLASRTLATGETQAFQYDERGRIVAMTGAAGEVTFAYDALGHRVSDLRDGRGVVHVYRSRHRLAETTVLGRFRTRFERRGDTLTITDPAGGVHRLRHLGHGFVERALSNGSSEIAQYDRGGRCLLRATRRRLEPHRPWVRVYRYSGEGDLLAAEDSLRGTVAYAYDAAHRLVSRTRPGGAPEGFAYDAAGNLLAQPGLADTHVMSGNRLERANGAVLSYDVRNSVAERREPGKRVRYRHDARDLLVGAAFGDEEGESWTAVHDPLCRRVSRTWRGETTSYVWDTDRVAAEIAPDGRLRVYVYADALALVPLLFLDYTSVEADPATGRRRFVFTDQAGCPLLAEDDDGRTVFSAAYDPYGAAHVDPSSTVDVATRWPGHAFDDKLGLHYNRFRYYSPELGRYLESDPIGISGGVNLYAYPASPLSHVDVRGLANESCEIPPRAPAEEDKGDEEGSGQPRKLTPEELDAAFGPATAPWMTRPGEGEFPLNAQIVRPGEPIVLQPYTLPNGQPGRYIFIVTQNGNMIICPEHGTGLTNANGDPRRATHVDLAQGGPARVSGEINPTNDPNTWIMNDDSGRYSQRPAEPGEPQNPRGLTDTRTPENLQNANNQLNQADLGGTTVTNEADLFGPQHYPTMKTTANR